MDLTLTACDAEGHREPSQAHSTPAASTRPHFFLQNVNAIYLTSSITRHGVIRLYAKLPTCSFTLQHLHPFRLFLEQA